MHTPMSLLCPLGGPRDDGASVSGSTPVPGLAFFAQQNPSDSKSKQEVPDMGLCILWSQKVGKCSAQNKNNKNKNKIAVLWVTSNSGANGKSLQQPKTELLGPESKGAFTVLNLKSVPRDLTDGVHVERGLKMIYSGETDRKQAVVRVAVDSARGV